MKLFVWDAATHKQIKSLSLDSPASCVTYSSDGGLIAVGYSDGPKKGTVSVFAPGAEDPTKLEIKGSGVEGLSQAAITTVKFGPSFIAAATDIGEIYLYTLEANPDTQAFPLMVKLEASTTASAIRHMDVSTSGLEIVANLDDDVVYFQKPTEPEDAVFGLCTPFVSTEEKPGPEFATFSTPMYTGLQGLYGKNGSGSYTSVAKPKSLESVVAAADSNGTISLFPYPTSDFGVAGRSTFAGHSSGGGGVCSIGFSSEDGVLLSAGMGDGCIIQWTFGPDEGYDSAIEAEIEAANAPPVDEEEVDEEEEGFVKIQVDSCDDEDLVDKLEIDGEEFISSSLTYESVEASKSTFMPADAADMIPSRELPSQDLSLKWIHGVSSQSTRNSVVYNDDGEIVYPAGAAVVLLNKTTGKQGHFLGHSDAVTALALSPDKKLCVSGQIGTSPKAIVWDTVTKASKVVFTLPSTSYGISAVAFSADRSLIAVASQDADHTIFVYSWADGALKSQAKTGEGKILCLAFNDTGKQLVAGGVKTFSVVTIAGKNMSVKQGQFGSALGGRKVVTCACWAGGDFVLGTTAGKLYRLEGGRKLAGETEVFEKGHVNCLTSLPAPADPEAAGYPAVVVAGEFGVVKILDETLGELKAFDLRAICPTSKSKIVRSACLNKDSRKLLVATKGSEIFEFSNPAGSGEDEEEPKDINSGALIVGHSSDQLWGCAAHPVKNEIATCGDDKSVNMWDLDTNKLVRSIGVGDFARSCDYSPNGHLLAVGLGGLRNGGAAGSYAAPIIETKAPEEETEVGEGEEKKVEEDVEPAPTDPWLKTLFAKSVKPREKEGAVVVLSLLEDEVRIVCSNQDAAGYICDIKFSPDGNLLAAASMDSSVYIYNCLKDFVFMGKCETTGGLPITHVDWSADSAYVMGVGMRNNEAQVSFFNASDYTSVKVDHEDIVSASWNTWTSSVGKTVAGCFPSGGKDLSVVNSVCRSSGSSLVASGDVSGALKIAKYPSLETGAAYKDFSAHSGQGGIGKVVFTKSDSFVASVGVGDRCVCVWDVLVDDEEDGADKEYGLSDDSDYVLMAPVEVEDSTGTSETGEVEEEKKEDTGAVELTWREKLAGQEAGGYDLADFELQAVYGVSSKAGLGYNLAGDAVYACGGASVIYKGTEKKFTVFSGSDGAVTR